MKYVSGMNAQEKMALAQQADKWLEKYPSLRAAVTSWEDAPVKDFDEGLELCKHLRRAKSFVEGAYKFNAVKCLDMIQSTLNEIVRIARPGGPRTESEKKTRPIKAFVPRQPEPDEDGNIERITEEKRKRMEQEAMDEEARMDKHRPQNLSAYIHLLPKELQQECNNVQKKYYFPLREYRTRLESLAENPDATDEQRAEMTSLLCKADDALAAFWEKVDKAYRIATGHEVPEEPETEKKFSEYTREDINRVEDEKLRKKLTDARIENNKKYLRRTDLPEGEETQLQLLLRARELQEWEVKITPRQRANMQHYGVQLTQE